MNTTTHRSGGQRSSSSRSRRPFSSSRPHGRGDRRGGSAPHHRARGGNRFSRSTRSSGNRSGGRGRVMPTFDPSQFINTNPVETEQVAYVPKHRFDTFGLSDRLARSIIAAGRTIPTPIQDQIIPEILKGNDVIGLAETGTGKTAAFLVPLIDKTLNEYSRRTLILTPTRELAIQIEDELKTLAGQNRIYSVTCVGGVNIGPQIRTLKKTNHFVIGTPGRVLDLIERGAFDPSTLTTVVLDEADRMLDMGFIHDMRKILAKTPSDRETLFFSATMPAAIKDLTRDFLRNPVTVSVKKRDVTASVVQDVVRYEPHTKFETLTNLLADPAFTRVIIFGAMKHSVEKRAKELSAHGIIAESIHGNKNHGQRQRSLARFKSGNARVLVATDVAARGIHVDNVSHVINYDLPNTFDDYVHRIGRTGRGDKRGIALTFVHKV